MAVEKKVCPECGVSIKEANYGRHLSRVHNKTLEEIEGPAPKEGGSKAKMLAMAVIVIMVVSLFAYYVVFIDNTTPPVGTGDTDGDGMPDSWEVEYGYDHTDPIDATFDSDDDGLSNLEEYSLDTHPKNADTDGDNIPDGYENDNDLDPNNSWDAAQDFDMDGESNLEEFNAGTGIRSAVKATITVEGYAEPIVVTLRPDKAPISVRNFLGYIEDDFYSGLIFHRIIDGFMIQGGGFNPGMTQKTPNAAITLEKTSETGLHHEDGAISMARTGDPNSATSQFFICDGPQSFLDQENSQDGNGYAVFGKVSSGMSTVRAISAVATASGDVPVDDVVITSITAAWTD